MAKVHSRAWAIEQLKAGKRVYYAFPDAQEEQEAILAGKGEPKHMVWKLDGPFEGRWPSPYMEHEDGWCVMPPPDEWAADVLALCRHITEIVERHNGEG